MLTLYTRPLSANGRKPLAVARQLGLPLEIRRVNVYAGEGRTPEFLALHPLGRVPVLVDGDFTLSESNAILVYLSEAHGDFRLFSRDPRARAEILRWLFWESSAWQPALSSVLAPLLALLESRLSGREFLQGSTPTLADFGVAGMATYFRHGGFPYERFPRIRDRLARVDALEGWCASADPLWNSGP